jgi:alpha-L-rhamnosidase
LRLSAREGVGKGGRLGYRVEELDVDIAGSLHHLAYRIDDPAWRPVRQRAEAQLAPDRHVLFDFGRIRAGFVGARLRCDEPATVYLVFDERRERLEALDFALGVGAVLLQLTPGQYDFESMEAYSLRFLRVVCLGGPVDIEDLWLREYAHPRADHAVFSADDPELHDIFEAARQTFRANAPDLFLDCPSRERGAYPCDGYFAARVEKLLTGETRVERNFLENFLLPDAFRSIPAGMLPHCYPSDRNMAGRFIPNWALWLIIQLEEYIERSNDRSLLPLARRRVEALFDWFSRFLNPERLLEDLEGWVFVEHSPANGFTAGVNHPTNLVYAAALDASARLFGVEAWRQQAAAVRAAVRRESWDGRWFADQSVRVHGALQRTAGRSETCQYHAFRFGIADPRQDAGLWGRLLSNWGPLGTAHALCWSGQRPTWLERYAPWADGSEPPSELVPANLFYGGMLRLELLARYGEANRLVSEIRAVFGPQAELGGALWEHFGSENSCCHGFASRVAEHLLLHVPYGASEANEESR